MSDKNVEEHAEGDDEKSSKTVDSPSVFDMFEPPPEIDPNRFGPIPIVPEADDLTPVADLAPLQAITDSGRARSDLAPGVASVQMGEAVGTPTAAGADDADLDPASAEEADAEDEASDAGALLADFFGDDPTDEDSGPKPVSTPDVEVEAPADLPHWTEPATGQVPAVVAGEQGDEVWSDLSGPRWHGEGPEWAGDDLADVFGFTPVQDPTDSESASDGLSSATAERADESELGMATEDDDVALYDDGVEPGDMAAAAGSAQRSPIARRSSAAQSDSSSSGGRNIPQAIGVGVAVAGLALAAFNFGRVTTLALIMVIVVLGSLELFNKMREVGVHPATLIGTVASASLPLAVYHRGQAGFMLVTALLVVFGALWYISGADTHRPALNLGLTFLGVLWVGGLASFASLIIWMPDGISILLVAVVITVVFDTAAYVGGRAFGKRPFHPASPNKTWEGTLSGVVGAVGASLLLALWNISGFSADLKDAAILGVALGILAPLGDLTESMIKRDLGVKDMGTLLPGHGGVLDRIDGLLFVLPGAYYLALVLI